MFLFYATLFVTGVAPCHAARVGVEESVSLDSEALVNESLSVDDGVFPDWASKGMQVTYRGAPATVLATEMVPMVELDMGGQTRRVPLKYVTPVEDDEEEREEEEGGGAETSPNMNVRQRIFCEVCLEGISSSRTYVPAKTMLNGTIVPETNLGRLKECSPSERDLWTRDDKFTIYTTGAPVPDGCPSKRRAPYIMGKLYLARRICRHAISKEPRGYRSCTDFVNSVAATGTKRDVECTERNLYTFR